MKTFIALLLMLVSTTALAQYNPWQTTYRLEHGYCSICGAPVEWYTPVKPDRPFYSGDDMTPHAYPPAVPDSLRLYTLSWQGELLVCPRCEAQYGKSFPAAFEYLKHKVLLNCQEQHKADRERWQKWAEEQTANEKDARIHRLEAEIDSLKGRTP